MIRALSSSLYTHVIEAESNVTSDRFMNKNTNKKENNSFNVYNLSPYCLIWNSSTTVTGFTGVKPWLHVQFIACNTLHAIACNIACNSTLHAIACNKLHV